MENRYGINILVSRSLFVILFILIRPGTGKEAGKILSVLSGGMLWPGLAHICWWGQMSLPCHPPAATDRGGHQGSVLTQHFKSSHIEEGGGRPSGLDLFWT